MYQKNYYIKSPLTVGVTIAEIKKVLNAIPHRSALLLIYETGFSAGQIKIMVEQIKHALPKVKLAGVSLFAMADAPPTLTGVKLNLILSEESEFEVVSIPCKADEIDRAVTIMKDRLDKQPYARAIELFIGTEIDITSFMKRITKGRPELGIFGTVASNETIDNSYEGIAVRFNIFKRMGNFLDERQLLIGDDIYSSGIIAVIFCGMDLKVDMCYALGWHPIGREMSFVKDTRNKTGRTILTEIDGMKAVDLFGEYMGVYPDEYMIANICEFPLILNRDGLDICQIPYDFNDEGQMYLPMVLKDSEKLRFSFATHDEVLGAVEGSYREMKRFNPQVLFLVLCGNRLNFLQEDAPLEWDKFKDDNPDLSLIHGGSELYYLNGKGGVLNSAHLAIGMREGEKTRIFADTEAPYGGCMHHSNVIPLAERMSVFLSKMTRQLEGMAEEAKAANSAKSAFLSSMSHEIRTPINAILGMDEMILRESNEKDIINYAQDIKSAGRTLLGIVNDVLDFSKIEAGKMNIIPVEYELTSVLNDLYTVIRVRAEDKGLKLILDADPTIPSIMYGDEIRIKQIVTNILTNAVKYTEKGSITLTLKRLGNNNEPDDNEKSGEELHGVACMRNPVRLFVSVKDTGIGIKEADIARLFGAFTRVDEERNRTIEGTGLGLGITRHLLSLMGSELKVESTYGKGSEFSFEIIQGIVRDEPIGTLTERFRHDRANDRRYKESFTAEDARILVVDDTSMNLNVIRNLLKKTKIGIDTVESGQEALDMVCLNEYDAIFLDHRMPVMDGIECFEKMQDLPGNKNMNTPVISLTANAVSGAREEYLRLGFADYLTKPIDPDKLEEMLVRYLPEEKIIKTRDAGLKDINNGTFDKNSKTRSKRKQRVVLIDDQVLIHEVAGNILSDSYEFTAFTSGDEAVPYLKSHDTDLILLDVIMPEKDGFSVLDMIRKETGATSVPVIFLTGDDNEETEIKGLKAGAWDYVHKPFVAEILLQRVRHTIELSHLQKELEYEVETQTLKIEHLSKEIMLALSKAVDAKDHYTQGHSERVAGYATMLASRMGMNEREQNDIYAMGLLHDVGKIGVPGKILNKKGRLDEEEFSRIKQHTTIGYDILKTITEMPDIATGARWHHERYNGTGYPDGKSGEDIPLPARIICIADSYDAMTSNRSYSQIREQDKVRLELEKCAGTQFDPEIVKYMIELVDEDKDYLMNEHHYFESAVAAHVVSLLTRAGKNHEEPAVEADSDPDNNEDELLDETVLPEALSESRFVDVKEGIKNCGSTESYLSILGDFYETLEAKTDELREYFNTGKLADYTIKVHALKSSARIVGAALLSELAAALEEAGDAGNIDYINKNTGVLFEKCDEMKAELASVFNNREQDDKPPAPESVIKDAYRSLAEFAAMEDFDLVRMVLDSIREYSLSDADKENFDRIGECLHKLDWEGIQKLL
ncbi:MAG: response regulator [Lachnospiraceae bacterium]|nr:response regulator [Lachnospiraceae bacterium]